MSLQFDKDALSPQMKIDASTPHLLENNSKMHSRQYRKQKTDVAAQKLQTQEKKEEPFKEVFD